MSPETFTQKRQRLVDALGTSTISPEDFAWLCRKISVPVEPIYQEPFVSSFDDLPLYDPGPEAPIASTLSGTLPDPNYVYIPRRRRPEPATPFYLLQMERRQRSPIWMPHEIRCPACGLYLHGSECRGCGSAFTFELFDEYESIAA